MVLVLDCNSEIGAHARSKLYYLICLRRSDRSRAITNRSLLLRNDRFSFMRALHVLSYHLIKVPCLVLSKAETQNSTFNANQSFFCELFDCCSILTKKLYSVKKGIHSLITVMFSKTYIMDLILDGN